MNSEVIKHGTASVKWNKKSFWQSLDLGLGCWMGLVVGFIISPPDCPFPFKVNVPYFLQSTSYMTVQKEMQPSWVNAFGVKVDSWMQRNSTWEIVFTVTPWRWTVTEHHMLNLHIFTRGVLWKILKANISVYK